MIPLMTYAEYKPERTYRLEIRGFFGMGTGREPGSNKTTQNWSGDRPITREPPVMARLLASRHPKPGRV